MCDKIRSGPPAYLNGRLFGAIVVVVMLAIPGPTRARQLASDDWLGRPVVPKVRGLTLKDAQKGTPVKAPAEVYHVALVNGKSLLLTTAGLAGWAPSDQIVLLDQADAYFTSQIRAQADQPFNHAMRAVVSLAQNGDLDRAIGDLSESIRLAPRVVDHYLTRAEVWRARGQLDKALKDCETALELEPRSVAALVLRASIWAAGNEYDKAIADFSEVIRRDPAVVPAYYGRAAVEGEKGEIDKAITDLDAAIRLNPKLSGSYVVRAVAWRHKGDLEKAVADLNQAIKLEPRNAQAYHNRGLLWNEKKAFDKAIEDYSQAIRIEPENPQGYCDRGFAWKALKQYDNAIADYSEALKLNPSDSDAYCGRGWAWREKQEFARSLSDFSQAIRIDPRDACALDGRAWIFATCPNATYRDGKKAVDVAIEACELTRWKEAYCIETLAAAYAETGDFSTAVKWQLKAIDLETNAKEKEDYRARLKLFQDQKPYREPHP